MAVLGFCEPNCDWLRILTSRKSFFSDVSFRRRQATAGNTSAFAGYLKLKSDNKKKYLALLSTVIQQRGAYIRRERGIISGCIFFFGFHVDGPMTGGAYKRGGRLITGILRYTVSCLLVVSFYYGLLAISFHS